MALGVGIAAGGGGAYAVFASGNQAGTAILLIVSAIFLLIGIQGTSLIRFSTGSNTVELERRRRAVEQAVKEIAKEAPERAAGILEGAKLALPALGPLSPPLIRAAAQYEQVGAAAQYELGVSIAITAMGYTLSSAGGDPDWIVTDQEDRTAGVIVKYQDPQSVAYRWSPDESIPVIIDDFERHGTSRVPLLLISNIPVPAAVSARVAGMMRGNPRRVVSWRDGTDNRILKDSLAELFNSTQSE